MASSFSVMAAAMLLMPWASCVSSTMGSTPAPPPVEEGRVSAEASVGATSPPSTPPSEEEEEEEEEEGKKEDEEKGGAPPSAPEAEAVALPPQNENPPWAKLLSPFLPSPPHFQKRWGGGWGGLGL